MDFLRPADNNIGKLGGDINPDRFSVAVFQYLIPQASLYIADNDGRKLVHLLNNLVIAQLRVYRGADQILVRPLAHLQRQTGSGTAAVNQKHLPGGKYMEIYPVRPAGPQNHQADLSYGHDDHRDGP